MSLRPSLAFNPRPRRLSTPTDAFELHPDIALYGIALSAFFAIEIQNFKEQERKLCMYCKGTGYLTCAECSTSASPGRLVDPSSGSKCYCGVCMGTAKVMCTSCLCTGRGMVTEHDPRIDPFD